VLDLLRFAYRFTVAVARVVFGILELFRGR